MAIYIANVRYVILTPKTPEFRTTNLKVVDRDFEIVTTPRKLLQNGNLVNVFNLVQWTFMRSSEERLNAFCTYLSAFNNDAPKLLPDTTILICSIDEETQKRIIAVYSE